MPRAEPPDLGHEGKHVIPVLQTGGPLSSRRYRPLAGVPPPIPAAVAPSGYLTTAAPRPARSQRSRSDRCRTASNETAARSAARRRAQTPRAPADRRPPGGGTSCRTPTRGRSRRAAWCAHWPAAGTSQRGTVTGAGLLPANSRSRPCSPGIGCPSYRRHWAGTATGGPLQPARRGAIRY